MFVTSDEGKTWMEKQKLLSADTTQQLGCSTAVDADTIVLGACKDDNVRGSDAGNSATR